MRQSSDSKDADIAPASPPAPPAAPWWPGAAACSALGVTNGEIVPRSQQESPGRARRWSLPHRLTPGTPRCEAFWQVFGKLDVKNLPKTSRTHMHRIDGRHKKSAPGLEKC